jgi:hypothetical protein
MVGLQVNPLMVHVSAQDAPSAPRKYSGAAVAEGDGDGLAVLVLVVVADVVPVELDVADLVGDKDVVTDLDGVTDGLGEQAVPSPVYVKVNEQDVAREQPLRM